NSKKDMDIKIIASNGKEYLTHKCILVVFSEYFRCIINGGFKETDQQELRMNVDSNVLELVLEFIYRRPVKLPSDLPVLMNLLKFSDMTMLKELNEVVLQKMIHIITSQNVFEILQFCIEMN